MNRETILPYALTTLQRVKDRIFDTSAQIPLAGTTNGTVTISGVAIPAASTTTPPGLTVGQAIFGSGIPFGAYIVAIGSNTVTISAAATLSAANVPLTVLNQPTAYDNLLIRFINMVTDWIGKETGGRKFVQTLVVNEVYSAYGAEQKRMVAKQCPICYYTQSGNMTANSPVVTGIPSTAGMQPGMPIINCAQTPPGIITTVKTVDSPTQITMSSSAGANSTGEIFQVIGLVSFQWRAGTPNAPSWTQFVPDQFELIDDGSAGLIRIYGIMPRLYNNMARITYWFGYLVNWANAGDAVTHTLPSDLTSTCENIVVRAFSRRMQAGKISESLDGATVAWDKDIDMQDKAVVGHYTQVPTIF